MESGDEKTFKKCNSLRERYMSVSLKIRLTSSRPSAL